MVSYDKKDLIGFEDLATRTGLPAQTLRRYAKEFAPWLPTRKIGRAFRLHPDAVDVVGAIRSAFAEGRTAPEVHELLAGNHPPVIDVQPGQAGTDAVPGVGETLLTTPGPLAERYVAAMEKQADALAAIAATLARLEAQGTLTEAAPPSGQGVDEQLRDTAQEDVPNCPVQASQPEIRAEPRSWWRTAIALLKGDRS